MATTEMTDDMVVQGARAAVRIALAKNQARGVSSIAYDRKTKTIYEIRSDGQRVPIRVRCDEQCAEEA
ncbi:MAG: Clp protease [Selenomonas sp.]|nr:Clp protease [Selenomonas sp.]